MEQKILEHSTVKVKKEPPVEFVLILPRPTPGWPAPKQQEDVKPKLVPSVKLTKFDSKWPHDSKLFQTFFTCPHCQIIVRRQENLTRHQKTCSMLNQAKFECDFCGKRHQAKWLMRPHMLKHSKEKKFCCTKCGFGFNSKVGLLQHSRSKKIKKCAVCDFTFSCELLLDRHRSESHGNVFKCDKCPYHTKREQRLMDHKRIHDKSFACETCQKKFAVIRSLKLHQMQHRHGIYAKAPEQTFDCGKCYKSFATPNYLQKHQRCVHDDKEARCQVCTKIFKNQFSLHQHSQIHDKVECSICHKMFSKRSLSSHLRSHSAEYAFKCELCGSSTKTKDSIKQHIERMHLLRKLVNDSKCREDFSDFALLEKLQLKHGSSAVSSERKFKCSKYFVTSNDLNHHKSKVHTEKLFESAHSHKLFKFH